MRNRQGIHFTAILFGFAADTLATFAVAAALIFAMTEAGIPEKEIAARMNGLSGLLLMLIFGLGFTVMGGYIAGRKAGRSELLHGAIVAGAGIILGLFLRDTSLPVWYEIVSFAGMIPAGMAGGYLARHRTGRAGTF